MKHALAGSIGVIALLAGSVAVATSTPAAAPVAAPSAAPLSDAEFLRAVQRSNDDAIAASDYVLHFTTDPLVRSFAGEIISAHATSNVQLQSAARSAQVPFSTRRYASRVPPILAGQREPALDHSYMREQVAAHETALAVLKLESARGRTPELKAFAVAQVAALQPHLDKAQNYLAGAASDKSVQASPSPLPSGAGSPSPMPSTELPSASPAASGTPAS